MEFRKPKEDLLDQILRISGCSYLSDLRIREYRRDVCRSVEKIPAEEFSLEEWQEAAAYLTGEHRHYADPPAARQGIMDNLKA